MANYRDMNINDVTYKSAIDLTGKQWYFVMAGSVAGEVTTATGASNPAPLGILQNSPSPTQEATVRVFGYSKLVCEANSTCGLTWARWVMCASDGQGESPATAGGSPVSARYEDSSLTSGSAVKQVYLFPFTACAMPAGS